MALWNIYIYIYITHIYIYKPSWYGSVAESMCSISYLKDVAVRLERRTRATPWRETVRFEANLQWTTADIVDFFKQMLNRKLLPRK